MRAPRGNWFLALVQSVGRPALVCCLVALFADIDGLSASERLALDEGGRTFPRIEGDAIVFSGACRLGDETVRVVNESTGGVMAKGSCQEGRWESEPFSLAKLWEEFPDGKIRMVFTAGADTARLELNVVNLLREGAKGDGITDDQAAIQAALDKASRLDNGVVYAPPGHTFAHSGTLTIDGTELFGAGPDSVLLATNPLKSTIYLKGQQPTIRNLAVSARVGDTTRQTKPDATLISPQPGCVGFWIDRITARHGASAGIFNLGGQGTEDAWARITNNQVSDLLADGIHNTRSARFVRIQGNTVERAGDDLIAVVSYGDKVVSDIEILDNSVSNNEHGRGITVVGGERVRIEGNRIESTSGAGVYIVSENSYDTAAVREVSVRKNVIVNGAKNLRAHAGIFVLGRESGLVSEIVIEENTISDSEQPGILLLKHASDIAISRNTIERVGRGGVVAMEVGNVELKHNRIRKTGDAGLHVGKGCTGFLKVTGNEFENINTKDTKATDVILISSPTSLSSLTIEGNLYRPGKHATERFIENLNSGSEKLSVSVKDNRVE